MWTEEKLRTSWAFWIEFDVNPKHRGWLGELLMVIIPFNCYGEPIPIKLVPGEYSNWIAKEAPGAEQYYPDYIVRQQQGPSKCPGMIQDIRSLDSMLHGCCPEILTGFELGGLEGRD